MSDHVATPLLGRIRSRMAELARRAEQAPPRLYAYGEMLVGIAFVFGASAIVAGIYLWILLAAKIAELLS